MAHSEPISLWPTNDDDDEEDWQYLPVYVIPENNAALAWYDRRKKIDYEQRTLISDADEMAQVFGDSPQKEIRQYKA